MAKKRRKSGGGRKKVFAGVKRTSPAAAAKPPAALLPPPPGAIVPKKDGTSVLTPAERKERNKAFKAKARELCEKAKDHNLNELLLKHEVGEFADQVFSTDKYGDHSAEELAKELGTHQDTVRLMHRFYTRYSREDVEQKFGPVNMSWRVIQSLISVEDKKERARLEAQAIKNDMTGDQVREAVRESNKEANEKADAEGKPRDRRGGLQDSAAFRNCERLAEEMSNKLDQYVDACTNLANITNEDKLKDLVGKKESVRKSLRRLADDIERALEA